jgi:hypothetical protein
MKRMRINVLLFFVLGLAPVSAHATLAETGNGQGLGEGGYGAAAVDAADSLAFFGSTTTVTIPGIATNASPVAEYHLPTPGNPLSLSAELVSFSSFSVITTAAFDPTTGFGYFTSSSALAGIGLEKIPITAAASPPTSSSVTVSVAGAWIGTAVLDTTNHFGYFGTVTSPSQVIKVRLTDLVVISSLTLPAGLDFLSASVIDTAGGFAYFASSTTPGAVAKIRLSNFTLAGTLTFNSGEGGVGSAIINVPNQLAYFGTHDSPGKVIQVSLTGLTRVAALTLPAGQNDLTSAVADIPRGFGYFGTNTSSGIVAAIALSNLTERTSLTLGAGENFLRSAVIDTTNEFAYFGTFTTPGRVIQVDLIAGPPVIILSPSSVQPQAGNTVAFSVTAEGRNLTYQWQLNGANIPGATSATYSRTIAATDDGSSVACVVTNVNGSVVSSAAQITIIPVIRAFPNPWRADRHAGVNMTFDGLLPNSTVKIFNLAAHWVKTLPPGGASMTWDLTNDTGENVASGYYIYVVTTGNSKQTIHGKLAIIR